MYGKFIMQLCMYAKVIRILTKRYFPIALITPLKLQEILDTVQIVLRKTNPDYDIVTKKLHLYYDMKLVIFGIDRDKKLVIQFPLFIQPYTQQPLILHQIKTVLVLLYALTDKQTLHSSKLCNIQNSLDSRNLEHAKE